LRETHKFPLAMTFAGMREHLKAVARELAAAKVLDRGDDVFFLDLGDARRGLAGEDLRTLVAERREEYQQELSCGTPVNGAAEPSY
jgi:pyruvate,water dikinase